MKNNLWTRFRRLFAAKANAAIDRAENPAQMADQLIREYTQGVKDTEVAVADVIGNLRIMEVQRDDQKEAVLEWGRKAEAATRLADEASSSAEKQRLTNLARSALGKQIAAEQSITELGPTIASHEAQVEQLKSALMLMRDKLDEVKAKRDQLVARDRVASAQEQIVDSVRSVDASDATSEMRRLEDKVRRREARARGKAEVAASTAEAQFRALDAAGTNLEVEARLADIQRRPELTKGR